MQLPPLLIPYWVGHCLFHLVLLCEVNFIDLNSIKWEKIFFYKKAENT